MWASAEHHRLYITEIKIPVRNRRKCRCGCGKKETHSVRANGISLAGGCELAAHRWKRQLDKMKKARK